MIRREDLALAERILAERERRRNANNPLALCPHQPTEKQRAFLKLDCMEALYGGAAGGGKSDALLMAALQFAHVPGYAALLLRRTYADLALPGAIMDRAKEWLIPKGVDWNDKDKRFTFASGATLTFGYLDTERDRYRYQGAELQFIGFDELTQFPEQWYRYLLSRLRRVKGHDVPIRARAASNPGGVGHEWVKRRFVDAADPKRRFIPASLRDNPHLDATEYEITLSNLDAPTRRQLLDGIWIKDSGGLVYQYDESRNVVDGLPELDHYLLGIDYGVVDATAFTILGWRKHDPTVYVVESYKHTKMSPSGAAEEVKSLGKRYAFERIVADIGGLGKGFAQEAIERFSLPIEAAEKNNKLGYIRLLNGELLNGNVKVSPATCKELVDEWLELPWTSDRSKESDGFDNHCSDSCLYAWRAAVAFVERPEERKPEEGTDEWRRAEEARYEARFVAEVEREKDLDWWNI